MIVALFSEKESYAVHFLHQQNMTRLDAVQYISHGISKVNESIETDEIEDETDDFTQQKQNSKNLLDQFCINLNAKSKEGKIDSLIGRKDEVDRTIQILCRRQKNNPLFVGDPGVGKTAITEGLAKRIVEKDVPGRHGRQQRLDAVGTATETAPRQGGLLDGERRRKTDHRRIGRRQVQRPQFPGRQRGSGLDP